MKKRMDPKSPEFRDLVSSLTSTTSKLNLPSTPILASKLSKMKDVDRLILEKLDDQQLLKACSIDKHTWLKVCDDAFFKRRLLSKYPEIEKYKLIDETWKQFFLRSLYYISLMKEQYNYQYVSGDFEEQYDLLTEQPSFIAQPLQDFISNTNFGNAPGTNTSIQNILESTLRLGILSRKIVNTLLSIFENKNGFIDPTDGKKYFRYDQNLYYLKPYIFELEKNDPNFNRNKFSFNSIRKIINKYIRTYDSLSPDEKIYVNARQIKEEVSQEQELVISLWEIDE